VAAVLTSWKEIAAHLGKGVRTVQRWERELGLPVRRPKPKHKQIVLAFPDELNAWLRGQSTRQPSRSNSREEFRRMQELVTQVREQTRMLHDQTAEIVDRLQRKAMPGNSNREP